MLLTSSEIAKRIEDPPNPKDPLIITPKPDLEKLRKSSGASVDLRLGTWFLTFKQSSVTCLDVLETFEAKGIASAGQEKLSDSENLDQKRSKDSEWAREYYIPFGGNFVLHPRSFVLGVTMEWIRLPLLIAGYVIGRSSWGRRGLIIATATGVHPRFTGCLTLEITNLGEIPIILKPGMSICQLFLHTTNQDDESYQSRFSGARKPSIGQIELDEIALKLAAKH